MTALDTSAPADSSALTAQEPGSLNVTAAIERDGQLAAVLYDPATLLVDVNSRSNAKLTKRFVASIRARGVLVPVIAVRTVEGDIRVRMGHRRTLAALEAGRQVPVIVVGDEGKDDAAAIDRILDQFEENEGGREGLSTRDQIGAAEDLALFGMPAVEISRSLHLPRKQVAAALSVAGSPLAKAATERHEFLTIPQAAVLAEFENDTKTLKALIAAAKTGDFDQVAQIARDERTDQEARTAAEEALTQSGTRLLQQDTHGGKILAALTDDEQTREPITADAHTACPGHGAYLTRIRVTEQPDRTSPDRDRDRDEEDDWQDEDDDVDGYDDPDTRRYEYRTVHVCTEPGRHHPRHQPAAPTRATPRAADMSPAEREEAARDRREVVKLNKEWESAQKVRLAWLGDLAGRQRAPKGTSAFLAMAMAYDGDVFADATGLTLAAKLLGIDASSYGRGRAVAQFIEKASEQRAQVIHLILVLAMYEAKSSRSDWRPQTLSPRTRRYLQHLSAIGYKLATVETRAATDPQQTSRDTTAKATAEEPTRPSDSSGTTTATDLTATNPAPGTDEAMATPADLTMATGEAMDTHTGMDTETPEKDAAA